MKPTFVLMALIFFLSFVFLTGCQKKLVQIKSPNDLEGKSIAVQEGTTGDLYVSDNMKSSQVVRFKRVTDAVLELKNGKADAIVLDNAPAKRIALQNSDLFLLPDVLSQERYAIAVRKENTDLLNSINSTLKRIKSDGTYDTFINTFFPQYGVINLPSFSSKEQESTIIMGTEAGLEPFEYIEGKEIVGFDVQIAHEIANDLNKTLKIENLSFDSLIMAMQQKKIDFIMAAMTQTAQREKEVDFSDSYYTASLCVIIRKESYVN